MAAPAPSLAVTDLLLRSAFVALDRSEYAHAERLLDRVDALRRDQDSWLAAEILRGRGLVALARGRYAEAGVALEAAEAAFTALGADDRLALVWRHRATLAMQDGDRALARALAERALAAFERRGEDEEVVATLGVMVALGDGEDGAANVLARALALAERLGLRRQLARLRHVHGDRRFSEGDFAGAVRSYEQAEALYRDLGDDEGLGRVWTSLGRLNRAHGRHAVALGYYRRALEALERAGDEQGVIQAVNAIATAEANLGHPDAARDAYERALALAERTGSTRIVNFQRGNLGGHYLERGDHARAIPLLRQSAEQESTPTIRAIRLVQLGSALAGAGRHADSLEPFDEAIQTLRTLNNRERLFGAYAARADAYRALGRQDEALADVRASLDVLEEVRRLLAPGDFLRRGFHQYTQLYASLGIRILAEAGRHRDALEVAEQARARAFLDLLAARPGLASGQATDSLLLTRDRAVAHDATALDGSAQPASPTRAAGIDQILAEARARRSTLLSYWVDAARTHVWVVRSDGQVHHATVDVADRTLVDLIRALWSGLPPSRMTSTGEGARQMALRRAGEPAPALPGPPDARPSSAETPVTPRRAARELHRLLIAPIESYLPRQGALLTVVPHGPLFRLSFAALLDPSDRYLVERYALAYGPSVSVLSITRGMRSARQAREARYLLVADPAPLPSVPGEPAPLPPLPGTVTELRAIASLVPAGASTTLAGVAATEPAVTQAAGEATVIHLATHGIVRDDDPFGSFLALAAESTSPSRDGVLTAEEIYGLRLQAHLVVLSACRSGLGEVSADGIVGLTRAFFFAGTPSVVATLWDVADGPSARLLRDFYAERLRYGDTARALRAAQLRMLASLRAGLVRTEGVAGGARLPERPAYWAGFVLVGEP